MIFPDKRTQKFSLPRPG